MFKLLQELDGARIQIVEVSNAAGVPPSAVLVTPEARERDDDTDSLSDVALRIHDDNNDDAQ
ncbi:jg18100, partial [Pararge aegeria aegeria]